MQFKAVTFDKAAVDRVNEAARLEKRLRIEAILEIDQDVGPFVFRQCTIKDILKLSYLQNPLVCGGKIADEDYLIFAFMLRPHSDSRTEKEFAKQSFSLLNSETKQQIKGYINAQINDLPSISASKKVNQFESSEVDFLSLVDLICSEYGTDQKSVLDLTLGYALQLTQQILGRQMGNKYPRRNPIRQQAIADEMNNLMKGEK